MPARLTAVVTAYNEAEQIGATLAALAGAFPGARRIVADDGSTDATAHAALQAGAEVVSLPRMRGKGEAATLGVRRALAAGAGGEGGGEGEGDAAAIVLLCDADLGASAARLPALVAAVEGGEADLAVASFARRVGGGFGIALACSGFAIRDLTGLELAAPLSGQRAMRAQVAAAALPFAHGFGMETGMTVDAHRAGFRVEEVELDLEHRATGRSLAGFAHRARQARDILRAYAVRRLGPRRRGGG